MNTRILSFTIATLFLFSGFVSADEEKEQAPAIEVVGIVTFADNSGEIPSEVIVKEELNWLVKSFQKIVNQPSKTYKISLEGSGKDLVNLVGKRIKMEGTVQEHEGSVYLFAVQKYQVLIELVGNIKTESLDKDRETLLFVEEPQASFKYKKPWELEIAFSEELDKLQEEKIRIRGTLIHENDRNMFKILRHDKVNEVECSLATIKKDDDNNPIEAQMQQTGSERIFNITMNETAKEFLRLAKVGDKVLAEGIIENEDDAPTFEPVQFTMISTEEESSEETSADDSETSKDENEEL